MSARIPRARTRAEVIPEDEFQNCADPISQAKGPDMVLPVMMDKDTRAIYDLNSLLDIYKRGIISPESRKPVNARENPPVVVQIGDSLPAKDLAERRETLLDTLGIQYAKERSGGTPAPPPRLPPRRATEVEERVEQLPHMLHIPQLPHLPPLYHEFVRPLEPIRSPTPAQYVPSHLIRPARADPIHNTQPILQIPVYQAFDENSPSGQTIRHMYETEHPGYEVRFVHDAPHLRAASSHPVPPAPPPRPHWQQPQPQHPPWFGWLPNPANLIPREAWFV